MHFGGGWWLGLFWVICFDFGARVLRSGETYYFSTHGCNRALASVEVSLEDVAADEAAFAAAAAARALLSKKLAIMGLKKL